MNQKIEDIVELVSSQGYMDKWDDKNAFHMVTLSPPIPANAALRASEQSILLMCCIIMLDEGIKSRNWEKPGNPVITNTVTGIHAVQP